MQILRHYPFSILTVLAIWYLSFFTPPHTQLEEINNFDKLVHVCMYGGLSSIIWIEYLIQHKQIKSLPLIMRLSQNKLEMASVVSFQIEVIWISLKR